MSELKCCKICGAFTTCTSKNECCPECQYFDPMDSLCMAPDSLKKAKKAKVSKSSEETDPDTFLFEDDDEEDDSEDKTKDSSDDDDFDSFNLDDDWD